jgi:DNA repair protein RecO (recombination protein O)
VTPAMQPAWVLSRQSYRDSSFLVHFMTANEGRLTAIVKGVHRKQRGGSLASLMQPFSPVLVSLGGKSELRYLAGAESAGIAISLPGEKLFIGLYLNELLTLLLPKFDPSPTIFAAYGASLAKIADKDDTELILRRFELLLFDELGYQIQWHCDHDQNPIDPTINYVFQSDKGFVRRSEGAADLSALTGQDLLTLSSWQHSERVIDPPLRRKLKQVMRQAIEYRLGGRALRVRDAVNQWRQVGNTEER